MAAKQFRKFAQTQTLRPIRTTDVLLPLGDSRFSWEMFEQFCELLIGIHSGGVVHRYGKRGEAQKGIDFCVEHAGETWTYQCRRYKRFTIANAQKARTDLTFNGAAKHFLLIACEVGSMVRDTIRTWRGWDVFDARDLSNRVATLPLEDARRILDLHFGSEFRREFLGLRGLTTFLPPSAFFPTDERDLLRHDLPIQGRQEQVKSLEEFASGQQKIALVTASGGQGKTRLLKAFADRVSTTNTVRFVAAGMSATKESVDDLPLAPVIMVADDAHSRDDIPLLLEIVRQRQIKTKLVISARPHAEHSLHTQLSLSGLSRDDIAVIGPLGDLGIEDVKRILKSLLPRISQRSVERLVKASSGSPLLAVVLARLVQRKTIDLTRLSRDPDVRHTVLERFRDESVGLIPNVDAKLAQSTLRLLAAIGPCSAGSPDLRQAMAAFLGITEIEFAEILDQLISSGLVRERGYSVRVVPDVLADHILEDACLVRDGKRSTGFATHVFRAFSLLAGARLLRNIAQVDWRARGGAETPDDVFADIWADIRAEFERIGAYERGRILEIVRDIAFFQPRRALELVDYAIRTPLILDETDRRYRYDEAHVARKIAPVLKRIAYHDEYVVRACRLLWQIGCDTEDPQNVSAEDTPIGALYALLAFEEEKPTDYRARVMTAIERMLAEPDAHDHRRSLIEVVQAALTRQGMDHVMTSPDTFSIQAYLIRPSGQRPLRKQAIDVLRRCSRHTDPRVALKAVAAFARLTKPLFPLLTEQRITARNQSAWKGERLAAFTELEWIAANATEPLIALEARHEVRVSIDFEHDTKLAAAAARVADAGPNSELRRVTECLIDSRGSRYTLHEDRDIAQGHERQWERQLQRMRGEAEWIVATYSATELLRIADDRLGIAARLGLNADPFVLLTKIGEVAPDYVRELTLALMAEPDHCLIIGLQSLLGLLIFHDADVGLELARRAASSRDPRIAKAAVAAMPWESALSARQREVATLLWTHEEAEVQAAVMASSRWFAKQNRDFVLEVLPRINMTSQPVAEALATVLGDQGLPARDFSRDVLTMLVRQFRHIPSLANWQLCEFLSEAAEIELKAVVGMLLDRIADAETRTRMEFEPVPHSLHFDFEKMAKHLEYADALRMTRDAYRASTGLRRYYMPILFKRLANVYAAPAQQVLEEWFATGNPELIASAAKLLREAPSGFVFMASEYAIRLLELAWRAGSDCYDEVASSLYGSAISGMKTGNHGKPFPQDEELRSDALRMMEELEPHSPPWRFYESLADHAARQIEWKLRRDADTESW